MSEEEGKEMTQNPLDHFLDYTLWDVGGIDNTPPSVLWAWVMFYRYVRSHGRPAGVVKLCNPTRWVIRLGCSTADFQLMLRAGVDSKAIVIKNRCFCISSLMAKPLKHSTVTMRRHRAKKKSTTDDTQPVFTELNAKVIRQHLFTPETTVFPKACIHVIINAHRLLVAGGVLDAAERLRMLAVMHKPPQHPIDYLNVQVGRILGLTVELTSKE